MTSSLNRPALVLNRSWQPVGVTTVARALVAVWNERARVVDINDFQVYDWEAWLKLPADTGHAITTGRSLVRIPDVVVLARYNRVPYRTVPFTRNNLFRRDDQTCQYCGERPIRRELTVDHVHPRSRGGMTTWENCVLACSACNHRKADRTPEQAGMLLQKAPAQPRWSVIYSTNSQPSGSWGAFLQTKSS